MPNENGDWSIEDIEADDSFFQGLKDGDFCIVLGAGFSYGIKNQANLASYSSIPLTGRFIDLTKEKFGNAGTFKLAADLWKDHFKDPAVRDLFRRLFLTDKQAFARDSYKLYKYILTPNWYRLYTFNFDDVFESIVELANRKKDFETLFFPHDHEFPSVSVPKYMAHIHGKVDDDSDLSSLIFFSKEYGNFYESTDNLYYALKSSINDRVQKKSLIILGCQFNEDIIYKNFLNKITRADAKIYHFDIEKPVIAKDTVMNFDYRFVKCSTDDFLKILKRNKAKIEETNIRPVVYHPYREIKDVNDLDKVSKNFSIVENPLLGRFSSKEVSVGWAGAKSYVSYNHSRLLNFDSGYTIFPITGAAGSGKSTLLFQNIDSYLQSADASTRRLLFLHPDTLFNLKTILEPEECYLIIVDALDRSNSAEEAINAFEPVYRLALGGYDIKFVFSIYESSWQSIVKHYGAMRTHNFSNFFFELKAKDARSIEGVYDSLFDYYELDKYQDIDWPQVKKTIVEKAGANPSFIRYIFEEAKNQKQLSETFFKNVPRGVYHLVWREISEIPDSDSFGVIVTLLLLANYPHLSLSRDSINYLLSSFGTRDIESCLEFIWKNVLKANYNSRNLKGLDPVYRETILKVIKNDQLIDEPYLQEFVKKYRDFYNNEFQGLTKKLIGDTKMLIQAKKFKENKHLWKAIELLQIDDSTEMLDFVTDCYSVELIDNKNPVVSVGNELRAYIDRLWNKRIWMKQNEEVADEDVVGNQKKQYEVYALFKFLVKKLYYNDPYKLHNFASLLRRFNLPSFDEKSVEFLEIKKEILEWYNRCNELQDNKDVLGFQGIAKLFLELNDFDEALRSVDNGFRIANESTQKNPFILSLFVSKTEILLTKAEILHYLDDKNCTAVFNNARGVLSEGHKIIEKHFPPGKLDLYNLDTLNNIRAFYTFNGQFVDRSKNLDIQNFPLPSDVIKAREYLEYTIEKLPEYKDTVYGYAIFILNNMPDLHKPDDFLSVVEDISRMLIARFEERKEPKIIDAIKVTIKFVKDNKLPVSLPLLSSLKKIANPPKSTPHLNRNQRWSIEKALKEMTEGRNLSKTDEAKIDNVISYPFNYKSAANIIRALFIRYCILEKKEQPTMLCKKQILDIYASGNIHYRFYVIRTFYSMHKRLTNLEFFNAKQLFSFCDNFIDIAPDKENIYENLIHMYVNYFYEIFDKPMTASKKVNELDYIINKLFLLKFDKMNKEKADKLLSMRVKKYIEWFYDVWGAQLSNDQKKVTLVEILGKLNSFILSDQQKKRTERFALMLKSIDRKR